MRYGSLAVGPRNGEDPIPRLGVLRRCPAAERPD